jgi:hypothetical protein
MPTVANAGKPLWLCARQRQFASEGGVAPGHGSICVAPGQRMDAVLAAVIMHLDATGLAVLDDSKAGGLKLGTLWRCSPSV